MGHQSCSDLPSKMSFSAGLVVEGVEDREGVFIEACGKPGDCPRLCGYQISGARKESRDVLFLPGFRFQFHVERYGRHAASSNFTKFISNRRQRLQRQRAE
jgi:hypothetical protein